MNRQEMENLLKVAREGLSEKRLLLELAKKKLNEVSGMEELKTQALVMQIEGEIRECERQITEYEQQLAALPAIAESPVVSAASLRFMNFGQPPAAPAEAGESRVMRNMLYYMRKRELIPIVSNSLRDGGFMSMFGLSAEEDFGKSIVAPMLAAEIGYLHGESDDISRMMQIWQIELSDSEVAKGRYLESIKNYFVAWAAKNDRGQETLIKRIKTRLFDPAYLLSDLLNELGYPRYSNGAQDPLRLLAQLDLPLYITTSYYECLEVELARAGKTPRTVLCNWSNEEIAPEHLPDREWAWDPQHPLVFHLFGLERYPRTMVVSMDDHLDFLKGILKSDAVERNSGSAAVPTYLWDRVARCQLLLLGYHLNDLDFQILYRGFITAKERAGRKSDNAGVVIQLPPSERQGWRDPAGAEKYLKKYFDQDVKFEVEFGRPEQYVADLCRMLEG